MSSDLKYSGKQFSSSTRLTGKHQFTRLCDWVSGHVFLPKNECALFTHEACYSYLSRKNNTFVHDIDLLILTY